MVEQWYPPKTWLYQEKPLLSDDLNKYVRDNTNFLKRNIALEDAQGIIIQDGTIEKLSSHLVLEAESGTSDDLYTINGCLEGDVILLRAISGHTITIKQGLGNIVCPYGNDVEISETTYAVIIHNGVNCLAYPLGLLLHAISHQLGGIDEINLEGLSGSPLALIEHESLITAHMAAMNLEQVANKNQNNGYAGLDAQGKINENQIPESTGLVWSVVLGE